MLGDSLLAGYGLAADAAPPARVEAKLAGSDHPVRVINAGVSGDTTADGLNRYEWSVLGSSPSLLIIALGANDYLNNLPPETARANLTRLVERARGDGIPVALLGLSLPTGAEGLPPREAAYMAIYPDLAAAFDLPLLTSMLEPVAGRADLIQADGLHPTAEGADLVADAIASFLAPIVAGLPD